MPAVGADDDGGADDDDGLAVEDSTGGSTRQIAVAGHPRTSGCLLVELAEALRSERVARLQRAFIVITACRDQVPVTDARGLRPRDV